MSKLSICCATALLSLAVTACTTAADKPPGDKPEPTAQGDEGEKPEVPEAPPAASAKIAVASVQLIQDCPDTEVEEPAAKPAADVPEGEPAAMPAQTMPAPGAAAKRMPGGGSFHQPCDQSTVQLSLEATGDAPVSIEIKAIRILSDGKPVGTLSSRKPKIFVDSTYKAWDQQLVPGEPIQVSYKLSMPAWDAATAVSDENSYGQTFTLELDIAVDGVLSTVSSPAAARERPHVIVT